ncbi:MAG TPA: cytochrome P450 [Candidatus Xenobia bacterium]|jgi:cytochrome P450
MNVPLRTFANLRAGGPIHQREDRGDWFVVDHAAVLAFLHDERLGFEPIASRPADDVVLEGNGRPGWLLHLSGSIEARELQCLPRDEHGRQRKILAPEFRATVAARTPAMEALVDAFVGPLAGTFDVVSELAAPLPVCIIGDLLGLPVDAPSRLDHLLLARADALDLDPTPPTLARGRLAYVGLMDHCLPHVRKPWPGRLLDRLHGRLGIADRLSDALLLLLAGTATMRGFIGHAIAQAAPVWPALRADPTYVNPFLEEVLRYHGIVSSTYRRALEDIPIDSERTIRPGESVNLVLAAANRDPAVFDCPDQFHPHRPAGRHLAFGHGNRFCLGAALARWMVRLVLDRLVHKFSHLEVVESRVRSTNFVFQSLDRLVVRSTP